MPTEFSYPDELEPFYLRSQVDRITRRKLGKAFDYREGNLRFEDRPITCSSYYTIGTAFVYEYNVPVWFMQYYQGHDPEGPEELKDFLAMSLLYSYSRGRFVAGRGEAQCWQNGYENPGLLYRNIFSPTRRGFTNFSGYDAITCYPSDGVLYNFKYQGGMLLGVPEENDVPSQLYSLIEA